MLVKWITAIAIYLEYLHSKTKLFSKLKCFKQNNIYCQIQRHPSGASVKYPSQLKKSTENDIIAMQRQNAGRGQNTYPKTKKPDNVRLLFAFSGILS